MKKKMMMTNMNIITIITIMTRKTNISIITMTTMRMTTTTMSMSITIIITTIMTMIMKAEKLRNTESVHLSTTAANLSTWASSMIS